MKPSDRSGDSGEDGVGKKRGYTCGFCEKKGHNVRTCPSKRVSDSESCIEQEGS